MKCPKCKESINKSDKVCPNCGYDLSQIKKLERLDLPNELAHLSPSKLHKKIVKLNFMNRHKKSIALSIVVVLIAFISFALVSERKESRLIFNFHDDLIEISNVNAAANSAFNIANGGNIVLAGENVFMTDLKGSIYQSNLALTQKKMILPDSASSLNVRNNVLWFIDEKQDHHVLYYKIQENGLLQKTPLRASELYIIGDYAYFINLDDNESVYSTKLEDSLQVMKMTTPHVKAFTVKGDWLYFANDEGIYRMPCKGGEITQISNDVVENMVVHNGRIFFIEAKTGKLKQIQIFDGKNEYQILVKVPVESFVVNGDFIYYTTRDEKGIYKMNLETNEVSLLKEVKASHIQIVSTWIYYLDHESNEFMFIPLDEKSTEMISITQIPTA